MFKPNLRFRDIRSDEITSEHFTYHLHQLAEKELITKKNNKYFLTNKGKDFVGTLDDKNLKIEKNPKVSVLVYVRRRNKAGKEEYLLQKRLKHPYYGKVGNLTGKVRYGETFEQAAKRELKEETGLEADLELNHIYHKIRISQDNSPLQDSIFAVFLATHPRGEIINPPEAKLFWTTLDKLFKRKDLFDDIKSNFKKVLHGKEKFVEDIQRAKGY